MKRDPAPAGLAAVLTIFLTSCASLTAPETDAKFSSCAAYAPAYQVTDEFMRTFNTKNPEAWAATFHFPSVRIASGQVRIINSPADLDPFNNLEASGWHHSGWAKREVVQCGPTKAHMLTNFVRYRADGSVLSQYDSPYTVEFKYNRSAPTARSSFAP